MKITPHFRYWCVHLIFSCKTEKKKRPMSPTGPRLNESWREKKKKELPGAQCANNFCRTHSWSVFMTAREAKCSGDAHCTASRAHKGRAKHGAEWLRLQHPASRGAHCPLPLCILGNSHHCTILMEHVFRGAGTDMWAENRTCWPDTVAFIALLVTQPAVICGTLVGCTVFRWN